MLDKSIPYKHLFMRMTAACAASMPDLTLPEGYSLRYYQDIGDMKHWCRIETSVREFDTEADAERYFTKAFLPHSHLLKDRCLFLLDPDGLPIATSTAWFADSTLGHQAALHWVAVCPEAQGRGLGKMTVQACLRLFKRLEPGCDIWLHTQTWSHIAVRLYHGLGFRLLKSDRLAGWDAETGCVKISENEYDQALPLLKGIMPPEVYNRLVADAL